MNRRIIRNSQNIDSSVEKVIFEMEDKAEQRKLRELVEKIPMEHLELLMHIGIDTVKLGGKFFETHVQAEQSVKKGDLLVSFDMDAIRAEGYPLTTPMIVCNTDDYTAVEATASGDIQAGADLLEIR